MAKERIIPEAEYQQEERRKRERLQTLIKTSGVTKGHISRATGVGKKVVERAANGEGVRMDNAARIEYYIKHKNDY